MTRIFPGRPATAIVTAIAALVLLAGVPLAQAASPTAPAQLGGSANAPLSGPAGWVSQIGTYDYLAQPDYDGLAPVRDALGKSTIGLGTFDELDGELVMIGGTVYRVGIGGTPRPVRTTRTTPFIQTVRFAPQSSTRVPAGTECSALTAIVDQLAGTTQGMVAVRLVGHFDVLTARSVPSQSRPYPPLAEVIAEQTVFPLSDVNATLVGFRTGPDLLGIGAPGLHLHGLTRARDAGGHILGCTTGADVRLSIQRTKGVRVHAAP